MRERSFLLVLFILFFLSCVWLTIRQESLLQKGDQNLVTISFTQPEKSENYDFAINHHGAQERSITLKYRYENNQEEETSLTLAPHEEKLFRPQKTPVAITIRYQDSKNETQEISLYKKNKKE